MGLGSRLDDWFANGDIPFCVLPYIDLEGIPVLRYQGQNVFVCEVRPRWDFRFRWSLVGYIGAGGAGIRYFLARRLGLRVGLDIARGPEETAIYIIVGNAWR